MLLELEWERNPSYKWEGSKTLSETKKNALHLSRTLSLDAGEQRRPRPVSSSGRLKRIISCHNWYEAKGTSPHWSYVNFLTSLDFLNLCGQVLLVDLLKRNEAFNLNEPSQNKNILRVLYNSHKTPKFSLSPPKPFKTKQNQTKEPLAINNHQRSQPFALSGPDRLGRDLQGHPLGAPAVGAPRPAAAFYVKRSNHGVLKQTFFVGKKGK